MITKKEYQHKYYLKHREELNKYSKEYNKKHPKKPSVRRKTKLKKLYGLSIDDYNKLFTIQNGCCKICGRHQSEFDKRLCIDHNHNTNEIRGLLCVKCNTALGYYEKWIVNYIIQIENYLKGY